jgi:hypothetical protein
MNVTELSSGDAFIHLKLKKITIIFLITELYVSDFLSMIKRKKDECNRTRLRQAFIDEKPDTH